MRRLAVVASHPIQYQAPWFRTLARVTDLEVFFCHRQDGAGQAAAGFGVEFEWDVPLLDGYTFTWLENLARHPDVSRFSGCDTPEIEARLRDGRFDACIVSGWYLKSYLQAIRACKRSDLPVLARGDSQLGTPRSAAVKMAKYLPYRWLMSSIAAHLYVGQLNREYLKHYGVPDSHLFFAPHFVDNEFFATRADAARTNGQAAGVRQTLDVPADATVFAFVGKLVENKRPADLIRALAARPPGSNAWGLIIGSGPLLQELEHLVAELDAPVRFAGFRNQSELPRFLAAADALVLPSTSETWGLAVNEAMACGLPAIVSSGTGCAPDLIENGRTGYQFPVGDVGALKDALLTLERSLAVDRPAIRQAVASKIVRYSCEASVGGTLEALDAVSEFRHAI
jgi:glycosyltransferase involved in cell wall biosynthesis